MGYRILAGFAHIVGSAYDFFADYQYRADRGLTESGRFMRLRQGQAHKIFIWRPHSSLFVDCV
jgi:hypothetical protein